MNVRDHAHMLEGLPDWGALLESISRPAPALFSAAQITPGMAEALFTLTDRVAECGDWSSLKSVLSDKIIAHLFYEPSSRTRLSFEAAALRLGASTISATDSASSSFTKGESLEDTLRIVSGYADLIVLRQSRSNISAVATSASMVPFLNGGDGENEHPTQALTDAYTIRSNLGRLTDLAIAIGFDARHSRSIRSFSILMSMYPSNRFTFVSPPGFGPPKSLQATLDERGISFDTTDSMESLLEADVVYVNRFQKERFDTQEGLDPEVRRYCVTKQFIQNARCIILDPLPRVGEIDPDVDPLPQAKYFEQCRNGVPVRMALLAFLLGRADRLYRATLEA